MWPPEYALLKGSDEFTLKRLPDTFHRRRDRFDRIMILQTP